MVKKSLQFLRVAGVARDSVVDGPGVRLSVFVQGCNIKCPRCHNPETWDFNGGYVISVADILGMYRWQYQGLTLSGGEPFDQDKEQTAALLSLAPNIRINDVGGARRKTKKYRRRVDNLKAVC